MASRGDGRFGFEDFKDQFEGRAFVSKLTAHVFEKKDEPKKKKKPLTIEDDTKNEAFALDVDLRPVEKIFDDAIVQLTKLRDNADGTILDMLTEAEDAEELHKEQLGQLNTIMNTVYSKFDRLDKKIAKVSHTAVRIGHTLETVDAQKTLNVEGAELIRHFLAFDTGDKKNIAPLFNTKEPARLHEAAVLIQTLQKISDDLRGPHVKHAAKAAQLIAETSQNIENQLHPIFEAAQESKERNSYVIMKMCARTLWSFPGRFIIKRFVRRVVFHLDRHSRAQESGTDPNDAVNQPPRMDGKDVPAPTPEVKEEVAFTIDIPGLGALVSPGGTPAPAAATPAAVTATPAARPKTVQGMTEDFEKRLKAFYSDVVTTCGAQCDIIAKVFPQPLIVFKSLLDWLFEAQLPRFLEWALNNASSQPEAFLRIFYVARTQTESLVAVLQKQSARLPSLGASDAVVSLDDRLISLFKSQTDEYGRREEAWLATTCEQEVFKVLMVDPQAEEKIEPVVPAKTGAGGGAAVVVAPVVVEKKKARRATPAELKKWISQALDIGVVTRMLTHLSTALKRSDKLAEPAILPETAAALEARLLMIIFDIYLDKVWKNNDPRDTRGCTVVESGFIPDSDPKIEPDPFFFQIVFKLNAIAAALQKHYQDELLPRIQASLNVNSVVEGQLRNVMYTVESKILMGLNRSLNAAIRHIARIIGKQKQADYRPKDEFVLESATKTCEEVCDFIHQHYDGVVNCLAGKNLDKYLATLAKHFHVILCASLKKIVVQPGPLGAAVLGKDVNQYAATIRMFHIASANTLFDQLRNIVSMFIVPIENLRGLVMGDRETVAVAAASASASTTSSGPRLSSMDMRELHEWLKMRADYQSNKAKILAQLPLDGA